jgi:hypothetical protein
MAIYEVVSVQTLFGQQVINRWNYVSAGTPAAVSGSFALAAAFGAVPSGTPPVMPTDTVFDYMREIQSDDLKHNEVVVKNLYSATDFYTIPFTDLAGKASEGSTTPFMAYGLRTNRTRLDINRGQKRIAGLPETVFADGGLIVPSIVIALNNLAVAMSDTISYDDEGNVITFTPVILGRDPVPVNSKGKKTYPLYSTESAQLSHVMQSIIWSGYPEVRSQVSRQYKRGS